jgi:hypothetical protein
MGISYEEECYQVVEWKLNLGKEIIVQPDKF